MRQNNHSYNAIALQQQVFEMRQEIDENMHILNHQRYDLDENARVLAEQDQQIAEANRRIEANKAYIQRQIQTYTYNYSLIQAQYSYIEQQQQTLAKQLEESYRYQGLVSYYTSLLNAWNVYFQSLSG